MHHLQELQPCLSEAHHLLRPGGYCSFKTAHQKIACCLEALSILEDTFSRVFQDFQRWKSAEDIHLLK
nr:class I SAM-dependent methyltransferase [Terribacillus saccharophilus]